MKNYRCVKIENGTLKQVKEMNITQEDVKKLLAKEEDTDLSERLPEIEIVKNYASDYLKARGNNHFIGVEVTRI